jgi:predicted N-formylglutamate amidohydrolase
MNHSQLPPDRVLGPDDPAPFALAPASGRPDVLVVCDHASNAVPHRLEHMGLGAERFGEHIAIDVGAEGVARGIASRLGAAYIHGGYSRLVVDLNRSERDASAIPSISDGVLIPANIGLAGAQREARFREIHAPYHAAIKQYLDSRVACGSVPVMIAIHSFTPVVSGLRRPWHAGILWDDDGRFAIPLLTGLRAERNLVIGDNEPYSGRHTADYTLDQHAQAEGLAHGAIEVRQDLIATTNGERLWAERLARVLEGFIDDARLYSRFQPARKAV